MGSGAFGWLYPGQYGQDPSATVPDPSPVAVVLDQDVPAEAAEFFGHLGGHLVGTRDHVGPSWIPEPEDWIPEPDSWIALRPAFPASILVSPSFARRMSNSLGGFIEVSRTEITLANTPGDDGVRPYDDLYPAGQGQATTMWRHDRAIDLTLREYDGHIDQVRHGPLPGQLTVSAVNEDLSMLEAPVPRRLTSAALFGETCPSAGIPIQRVIGTVSNVAIPHVVNDRATSLFVYLVSEGHVSVDAVKRNALGGTQLETLDPSEYSVSTSLYPGLTVVVTVLEQSTVGGGFHELYANVSSAPEERNPAIAFGLVIGDPVWGAGQPINAAALYAQAASMPAGLAVDMVIGGDERQRQAREWLSQILMVRGGRAEFHAETGWTAVFDSTETLSYRMVIANTAGLAHNMLSSGTRGTKALNDTAISLQVQYGYDHHTGRYRYTTTQRAVGAGTCGRPWIMGPGLDIGPHDVLQDRTSADIVACYLAARLADANDLVEECAVTEEGRQLQIGDIVGVRAPLIGLDGDAPTGPTTYNVRRVVATRKSAGRQVIAHEQWTPESLYTYTGVSLPMLLVGDDSPGVPVSPWATNDLEDYSVTPIKTSEPSLKQLGGVGDDVADDTSPVTSAAPHRKLWVQDGIYDTSLAPTALPNTSFFGFGQIRDAAGKLRAPFYSALTEAPASRQAFNPEDWYSGDIGSVTLAIERRVTGADTLGHPATGYDFVHEASAIAGWLYNESGHIQNNGVTGGDGRTAVSFLDIGVYQNGQGDAIGITFTCFQSEANPSATHFLGEPNVFCMAGGLGAGIAGSVLALGEFRFTDNGYSSTATGLTLRFDRTHNAPPFERLWGGFDVGSGGTEPIDWAYMASGPTKVAIDLSRLVTQTSGTFVRAAAVLLAEDRIYLNGTAGFVSAATTGDKYIAYESAVSAIVLSSGGVKTLKVGSAGAIVTGTLDVSGALSVGSFSVSGALSVGSLSVTNDIALVAEKKLFLNGAASDDFISYKAAIPGIAITKDNVDVVKVLAGGAVVTGTLDVTGTLTGVAGTFSGALSVALDAALVADKKLYLNGAASDDYISYISSTGVVAIVKDATQVVKVSATAVTITGDEIVSGDVILASNKKVYLSGAGGDDYLEFNSAGGSVNVVHNSNATLQVRDASVLVDGLFLLNDGYVVLSGTGGTNTGASTATFTASNKPGSTTGAGPSRWLRVDDVGTGLSYWVPMWTH